MPLHNRGETIERALASLSAQTFRDFEVVIVDCGSTDDTRTRVADFFQSSTFKTFPFPYKFETRDYVPVGVEDWNEPVRLARGTYIAMLEGDDYFLPEHLTQAHAALSRAEHIGVYATGNQRRKRKLSGLIPAAGHLRAIYLMDEVPPPSETIFIRCDRKNNPFLYNDRDYGYAPEIDLYIRIALAGFDAYYAASQDVVRRVTTGKSTTEWKYFADHFRIAQMYRDTPGLLPGDARAARLYAQKHAYYQYVRECHSNGRNCMELRKRLVEMDGYMFYARYLQTAIERAVIKTKMKIRALYV